MRDSIPSHKAEGNRKSHPVPCCVLCWGKHGHVHLHSQMHLPHKDLREKRKNRRSNPPKLCLSFSSGKINELSAASLKIIKWAKFGSKSKISGLVAKTTEHFRQLFFWISLQEQWISCMPIWEWFRQSSCFRGSNKRQMARLKEEQETASSPTLQKQVVNSLFYFFSLLLTMICALIFFCFLVPWGYALAKLEISVLIKVHYRLTESRCF